MNTAWLRIAAAGAALAASPAMAWNAHGHRTITRLALDHLASDAPAWLREPAIADRIAEQSCEPDRWRSVRSSLMNHEVHTEHYIDVDDLDQFGLTLQTVPRLRYEFVRAMVLAKERHPEKILPYDASKDPDHSKEWPGFLPHAIEEHYQKLVASFNTLRILEGLNDPRRGGALQQARENVIYEMGVLSHFVGDTSQPLHTTRHHHGWVGDNPSGYTRDTGFHAYIDGTIIQIHGFAYDTLKDRRLPSITVDPRNPWDGAIGEIQRSFERVEPIYRMQKDGTLEKDPGKDEIASRLCDGAATLGAFYNAAWQASEPRESQVKDFVKFSDLPGPDRKQAPPKSEP
jgi:hypothetical protein